ncbi:MAG: hypothetical protein O3C21_20890, partial [Verrucomicrobia bacterium]|nr:hypothetical protein [Verrucomicrobiota bacterium]
PGMLERILLLMLAEFLSQLFQSGRIQLVTARPLAVAETAAIDRLKHEECLWRSDFPGEAPPFSLDAGYWAAAIFYRLAQFFSARDLPAEAIHRDLSSPCPMDSASLSAIYSVDLTFRYLPDLYRLAAARASADPLVAELRHLADAWPLSSVGIPAGEGRSENVRHFLGYREFETLYVDRILEAREFRLLTDPRLQALAETTCGAHFAEIRELLAQFPRL